MLRNLKENLTMTYDERPLPENVVVEAINRPLFGKRTVHLSEPYGHIGRYYQSVEREEKQIDVSLRLIYEREGLFRENKDKLREQMHILRTYLNKDEPKILRLSDEPRQYDIAIVDGDIAPNMIGLSFLVDVHFICPDGFAFANDPVSLKMTDHIYCDSELPVPFCITGKATAGTITILQVDSGDQFTALSVPVGADIFIDTKKEMLRVNNELAMTLVPPAADFAWLSPGYNRFIIDGLNNTTLTYQGRML